VRTTLEELWITAPGARRWRGLPGPAQTILAGPGGRQAVIRDSRPPILCDDDAAALRAHIDLFFQKV